MTKPQKRIGVRIANELLMMLRSEKKRSRETSIYEPLGTDSEGNSISLLDVLESEEVDIIEEMELDANIKKLNSLLKDVLSERERQIIRLRYGLSNGHEVTQREIAERFGISRSYVSRLEKKALKKLREAYEEN